MFVLDWFKGMLGYLGLYKKNGKILFLGLDNAGKTTLLRRLKDDKMSQHDPTMYAHSEELVLGNVRFKAFDIGGHKAARKAWKSYFPSVDGIIYLVDAAESTRFEESKIELDSVLSTPELSKVPIVILGNKIDKKEAVSEEELRMIMGLSIKSQFGGTQKVQEIEGRQIELFMCSVAKKQGLKQIHQQFNLRYAEGFQWLSQFLK